VRRATLDPNAVGGAPAADAEREPTAADREPAADLLTDLVDGDDDPRETTKQLLEGLRQLADAVLREAMRDFLEPELAFDDDERVAMFGSTTWMKTVGSRRSRFRCCDASTRTMSRECLG
jgi:hypothetical protein